jgi:hypothetical protein
MSIIRCPGCERNVDTDFEDTEDARIGEDLVTMCWPCFDKHEAAVLAEGRALAAEHQRDLDRAGDPTRKDLDECARLGGLLRLGTYR